LEDSYYQSILGHIKDDMKGGNMVEIIKSIHLILSVLAWPVTIIVLVAILKNEIKAAIYRIESAKFPGGTELKLSKFGESKVDNPSKVSDIPSTETTDKTEGNWNNIKNIYWLGHDLMWTVDVILRGAAKHRIVHGLRQSLHQITALGLKDTKYGSQLNRLFEEADTSLESDWNETKREQFAVDLKSLLWEIGVFIKTQQKNPPPEGS